MNNINIQATPFCKVRYKKIVTFRDFYMHFKWICFIFLWLLHAIIHPAKLPVRTSQPGESLCIGVHKLYPFIYLFVGIIGTCISLWLALCFKMYIIMYFCANIWSCIQKDLWTSYISSCWKKILVYWNVKFSWVNYNKL